jgi:hypothetical protein
MSSSTRQKFDELEKYLNMTVDDKFKIPNPLPFWQFHEDQLPHLAKLVRQLYSIPATSAQRCGASVQCCWSSGK